MSDAWTPAALEALRELAQPPASTWAFGFAATEVRWEPEPWPAELREFYGPAFDCEGMGV